MPSMGDLVPVITLFAVLVVLTPIAGRYMAAVLEGERTVLSPVLAPVERGILRVAGVDPTQAAEQACERSVLP